MKKIIVAGIVILGSLFVNGVALAAPAGTSITLGASIGKTADVININGSNYHKNDSITVTITGHSGNIVTSAITVGNPGTFSGTITIPSDATEALDTVTASDISGNTATTSFTFDKTSPTGLISINNSASYASSSSVILNFSSVSSDVSQIQLRNATSGAFQTAVAYTNPYNFTFSNNTNGTHVVSVRFIDAAGNQNIGVVYDDIILDTTKPVVTITGSSSVTLEKGSTYTDSGATATDNLDGNITTNIITTGLPINSSSTGSHLVVYRVSDSAGNISSSTRTVNVVDTTAPTISFVDDVDANGPVATDTISIDFGDSSTKLYGFVSATGTCTVSMNTNKVQNTYTGAFDVTSATLTGGVSNGDYICAYGKDLSNNITVAVSANGLNIGTAQTVPVITITNPATSSTQFKTVTATTSIGTLSQYISTSTVCSNAVNAGLFSPYVDTTFNSESDNGKVICYKAVNGTKKSFLASNVVSGIDTTAPQIATTTDIVFEATGSNGALVSYSTPNAFDLVDGTTTVSCLQLSGFQLAVDGSSQIVCSATDTAGNSSTSTFNISVEDTTGPSIYLPTDINTEADSLGGGTVVNFTATSSDLVDGVITPVCTPASGSVFATGTTSVLCEATDSHSNYSSSTFNVTISDTEAPTLSLPADFSIEATGVTTVVNFNTSAYDVGDGTTTVSCLPTSGSLFATGTTIVACSSQDIEGHVATGTFNVSVVDTTKPTLSLNGNSLVAVIYYGTYNDLGATASDIVDGNLTSSISVTGSVDVTRVGTYTLTYNVSDLSGNAATPITRTVSVVSQKRGRTRFSFENAPIISDTTVETPSTSGVPQPEVAQNPSGVETPEPAGQVLGAEKFFFSNDLKLGSKKTPDVTELQNRLRTEGFFKDDSTGYFGKVTKAAVKEYQKAHNIINTGYVGKLTRGELNK